MNLYKIEDLFPHSPTTKYLDLKDILKIFWKVKARKILKENLEVYLEKLPAWFNHITHRAKYTSLINNI